MLSTSHIVTTAREPFTLPSITFLRLYMCVCRTLPPTKKATSPESVQAGIESTLQGVGGRVYGGHIFMASGNLRRYSFSTLSATLAIYLLPVYLHIYATHVSIGLDACHFWDAVTFVPLTDQILVGGDILVSR